MYILSLNHMTGKSERLTFVARSENRLDLVAMISRETVEPYQDGQWHKTFRAGGPLEWFNPPNDRMQWNGCDCIFEPCSREEYVLNAAKEAERRWDTSIQRIPLAESLT